MVSFSGSFDAKLSAFQIGVGGLSSTLLQVKLAKRFFNHQRACYANHF
jgi:hypothetical protein